MFSKSVVGALPLLISVASAHFKLDYPAARGFNEDVLGTFPCGGQDTVSTNRTVVSTTSIPIELTMGHDEASVEVLIGLGNDPGSAFNIVLKQTFREEGLGSFCLPAVAIPSSLNITDGQNATIQVITNGDPNGGLYNCADITFSTTTAATAPSSCTNGTGVTAVAFTGASASRNANESTAQGGAQSGSSSSSSSSSSGSSTSTAASSTPTHNSASIATVAWSFLGAAVFGAVAVM